MRRSILSAIVMSATVIVCFVLSYDADAQQINLTYSPKKGDSVVYDVQLHANAGDEAGLALVTHATSTLAVKVSDVKRDPDRPADETFPTGAAVDISQKNASVKFVSGKSEKTIPIKDDAVTISAVTEGKAAKVFGSPIDGSLAGSIIGVCTELGATERPKRGDKWEVPITLKLRNEAVPCRITYELGDAGEVGGEQCVIVSSAGSISHNFKKNGPVKNIDMTWTGKAYYAHARGQFALVVVEATAKGVLADGTRIRITDFNLQMTPRKAKAALPGSSDKMSLAGPLIGANTRAPMMMLIGAVILLGAIAAASRIRPRVVRCALMCLLSAAIVAYGIPLGTAEAASPDALIAFSQMATGALYDIGGLSVAGGAGVAMTGTPSTVLTTPYCAILPWAGAAVRNAGNRLGGDFVEVTEGALDEDDKPVGAVVEPTSGGLFSAGNLLIGGGILAASAGAGIAAYNAGGGGGGGGDSTTQFAPIQGVDADWMSAHLRPRDTQAGEIEGPDVPPDIIDADMDGAGVTFTLNTTAGSSASWLLLRPPDTNTFTLACPVDGGGHNKVALFRLELSFYQIPATLVETKIYESVSILEGESTQIVITTTPDLD